MGNPGKSRIFAMPVKCLNTAVNSQKYWERPRVLQIPHMRNCVLKLPLTQLENHGGAYEKVFGML